MLSISPLQSSSRLLQVSLAGRPALAHTTTLPAQAQTPFLHSPTPHCAGSTPLPQQASPVNSLGLGAGMPLSTVPSQLSSMPLQTSFVGPCWPTQAPHFSTPLFATAVQSCVPPWHGPTFSPDANV